MRRAPSFAELVRCRARLARWLGPWSPADEAPRATRRRSIAVAQADDRGPFEAWCYTPQARPIGAYLIAPGLQLDGPADPRLDRFCRILAHAGFIVLAPFLPDYVMLRAEPTVVGDFERCLSALRNLPEVAEHTKPGVIGISFGSLPALLLASNPEHAAGIGGLLVLGGYADWRDTVEFFLSGGSQTELHDPLNLPAMFINLIDCIEGAPADPSGLLAAWREFAASTWGRPEMKARDRYVPVARRIAAGLPESERALFLIGCRVEPGGEQLCRAALAHDANSERSRTLDPRPHLENLSCSVCLVHGVHDDVIPSSQMEVLRTAIPGNIVTRTYLTGFYDHAAKISLRDLARNLVVIPRELRTMAGIVEALASFGSSRA